MIYKEILKFISGVFFWDGIIALWMTIKQMYPIRFFGIVFTQNLLMAAFFFDLIAALVIAYFAWVFPERKSKKSKKKSSRRKK